MKRLHTFMLSATFAATILGSTKLLIKPQLHHADTLPIVTTVSPTGKG
jgi:hypothetical protein